jgi:hypothetical protein
MAKLSYKRESKNSSLIRVDHSHFVKDARESKRKNNSQLH